MILNIYKPEGWLSFRLIKEVRKLTGIKKVGHTGTLDPFAEGVMVVCTGSDTKKTEAIMNMQKEYIAVIEMGKVTDTDDITGNVIKTNDVGDFSDDYLQDVLKSFEGEILQVPPQYSAKKIKGVRAYKLARSGINIKLKSRKIFIHTIEYLERFKNEIKIRIICSKGTYIRSLARDFGEKLECGAYLKSLIRTRVGEYSIENSVNVNDLNSLLEKISD